MPTRHEPLLRFTLNWRNFSDSHLLLVGFVLPEKLETDSLSHVSRGLVVETCL